MIDDFLSSATILLSLLTSVTMVQSPPLTGLRVLEFAGLAPGKRYNMCPLDQTC